LRRRVAFRDIVIYRALNSGFLNLLTIGGGPSVSGYGSRGWPLFVLDMGDSWSGGAGSLIGVLGGRGGGVDASDPL